MTHPFFEMVEGRAPYPECAKTLGMQVLEAVPGSGQVTTQFQARPEFANPIGNVQGGFIAAMLDDTIGPAIAATPESTQFSPTLEIKVSFLRAARVGASFIGRGRVVHRGRSVVFAEAELEDAGGKLIARARASAHTIELEP